MIPIEIITPPTCAYEAPCKAQAVALAAQLAETHPGAPRIDVLDRCSLLRRRDVKEWQVRDCQKGMGFSDA